MQTGLYFYPKNHGPNNTARGRDHEVYDRNAVKLANYVSSGGGLTYGAGTLDVTLGALRAYIDGRQVLDPSDGSFPFTLPANETRYIMIDRAGRLFHRDTNDPVTDTDLLLWTVTTNGVGVTAAVDNRRLNQFTEVGLNSDEYLYLSTDRTKSIRYGITSGRVEVAGALQVSENLHWKSGTGFVATLDHAITADRTYTFPDAAGTLALVASTLTEGSIAFAGASGILSQDNANFYWDNTSKDLKLGAAVSIYFGSTDRIYRSGTTTLKTDAAWQAASFNGLIISTTTGTLAVTSGKTLTVSDSTTLATNSITFAGTQVLTLTATKNVTFADAFATSGAFGLTLTVTALTNVTLPTTGTLATLAGTETLSAKTLSSPKVATFLDTNGVTILTFTPDGTAVNYLDIRNWATGGGPVVRAIGTDTNIDINITPKGTGTVRIPAAGFIIGSDVSLYRSAANVLKTDDSFLALAVEAVTALSTDIAFGAKVTGDTLNRLRVDAAGKIEWSTGSGSFDTALYRGGSNLLVTEGQFRVKAAATSQRSFAAIVGAETEPRISIFAGGSIEWGDGTTRDVNLYRAGPNSLRTDDSFSIVGGEFSVWAAGDTVSRFAWNTSTGVVGGLEFGPGNAARDTNLYRLEADVLASDDAFRALTSVQNKSAGYSLVAADKGSVIRVTAAATITVPDGLPVGFSVMVVNDIAAGGTVTIGTTGAAIVTTGGATTLGTRLQSCVIVITSDGKRGIF